MHKLIGSLHVIPEINPASYSGTITGDRINMQGWDLCTFVMNLGALHDSADGDLTVLCADAATSGNSTDLGTINWRTMTTTDTWGAFAAATSNIDFVSGGDVDVTTDDNGVIIIAVTAAEVAASSSTYDMSFVSLDMSSLGQACLISCVAVMSRGRYMTDPPITAIA